MLFDDFKKGEKIRITDARSTYYEQIGEVDRRAKNGGLYVKHSDGRTIYHPWRFERVRPDPLATEEKVIPGSQYETARNTWSKILDAVHLPQDASDQFERVHNLLSVASSPMVQNVQTIFATWTSEYQPTGKYDIMSDLPLLHEIYAAGGWSVDPKHPLHT